MDNRDLLEFINKQIIKETKYLRIYDGKVVEALLDGKVKVTIDSLGWDTPDKAAICTLTDKNSLTSLNVDDIVKVGFTNNNPAQAYILGKSNNFIENSANAYLPDNSIDVIYQNKEDNVKITFDKTLKELSLVTDATINIRLENGVGTKIELGKNSVKINGTNSEILL